MNTLRVVGCLLLALSSLPAAARDIVPAAQTEVSFSPKGGAQELVIRAIESARESIRMAAYSFTSKEIARALVDANRRSVDVRAVLSNQQGRLARVLAPRMVIAGKARPCDRSPKQMGNSAEIAARV